MNRLASSDAGRRYRESVAEEQKRLQDAPSMFSDLTAFAPKQEITWVSKETERLYDDIVKLVEETKGKLNFHDALIALCCREGHTFLFL
jgi:hypothetical protein